MDSRFVASLFYTNLLLYSPRDLVLSRPGSLLGTRTVVLHRSSRPTARWAVRPVGVAAAWAACFGAHIARPRRMPGCRSPLRCRYHSVLPIFCRNGFAQFCQVNLSSHRSAGLFGTLGITFVYCLFEGNSTIYFVGPCIWQNPSTFANSPSETQALSHIHPSKQTVRPTPWQLKAA